jgi:hypothetical protein
MSHTRNHYQNGLSNPHLIAQADKHFNFTRRRVDRLKRQMRTMPPVQECLQQVLDLDRDDQALAAMIAEPLVSIPQRSKQEKGRTGENPIDILDLGEAGKALEQLLQLTEATSTSTAGAH